MLTVEVLDYLSLVRTLSLSTTIERHLAFAPVSSPYLCNYNQQVVIPRALPTIRGRMVRKRRLENVEPRDFSVNIVTAPCQLARRLFSDKFARPVFLDVRPNLNVCWDPLQNTWCTREEKRVLYILETMLCTWPSRYAMGLGSKLALRSKS